MTTARGSTRDAIVSAALALFRERGFEGTTMRAVAERAGVSVGNAYYYFSSKDELVQGFYDQLVWSARNLADPEIIVTFDADGQHRPEDIRNLIDPIVKNEADIVLGSRFMSDTSEIPFVRRLVLKGGVIFTNAISRVNLTDTHNGLRALGRKAIYSINITQRGMEHASEIIDEIKRKELRYQEVPVEITYSEYAKMKGQRSSNFFKLAIKIILKKLY